MQELTERDKTVLDEHRKKIKNQIENQNRVPILLAIEQKDWLSLQKSEVTKFGSKTHLEEYTKAWADFRKNGVLYSEGGQEHIGKGGFLCEFINLIKNNSLCKKMQINPNKIAFEENH